MGLSFDSSGNNTHNQKFSSVNAKQNSLPSAVYSAVKVVKDGFSMVEIDEEKNTIGSHLIKRKNIEKGINDLFKNTLAKSNLKLIATGISGKNGVKNLASELWLKEDIVSFIRSGKLKNELIESFAQKVRSNFDENNISLPRLSLHNEVEVDDLVGFEDYKKVVPKEQFSLLVYFAKKFKGKRVSFINATPQGGGVAIMRHALMRLFRLVGVDAHWYVLEPKKEVFEVTKKKFHNVLQAVAEDHVRLTSEDKKLYRAWIKNNAHNFESVFRKSDVVVIDDPQPSGLIPYIKKTNPNVKIVYRSHIHIESDLASKPHSNQHFTWSFIWNNIKGADCFVSHPIKDFVPEHVPHEKIVFMPATTDPLDGLNKPLTDSQMSYYTKLFNRYLLGRNQLPLDEKKEYIIQIARFDPSKGIPDVIESYRLLRQMLAKSKKAIPQLIIAGNGSVDDPDGIPVYNMIVKMLFSKKYLHLSKDVKVARLPHMDQLLNTLLRKSKVALQLSLKEGFEIKVTEALMKGKPVVAYKTGGIPLQIQHEKTGYLVERGNTMRVAKYLYSLFADEKKYRQMSNNARRLANKDCLTVPNAIKWLFLSLWLLEKRKIEGNFQTVNEMIDKSLKNKSNCSHF